MDDDKPPSVPELLYGLNRPLYRRWPRRRLRPLGCLAALVILVVVGGALAFLPNPWVFHIGGQFTPDRSWHGVGTVSATNGGQYALYVGFKAELGHESSSSDPYHCHLPTCDTVEGEGKLCALSGMTYPLLVRGQVHTWWATDGARTGVQLSVPNPDGSTIIGVFEGHWRGQQLELADSTDFTAALTREGAIRSSRSTTDDGTARTTLRPGTEDDFDHACHSLTAG
jgi:hypothetical protein